IYSFSSIVNNKQGIIIQTTTPTDNHLISSVIKMHYHLSQTIVHITLNLILMKQQEVWQQVPAYIEKTKNILLYSQTTIYNKKKIKTTKVYQHILILKYMNKPIIKKHIYIMKN